MITTGGSRLSRGAVMALAAFALTTACTTGEGRAPGETPTRPVVDARTPAFDSATRDDAEFNGRFRHETAADNLAVARITVPTMLMTAEGLLPFTRSTVEPRMSRITRAVEVPGAGHWLPEENPAFVTAELLAFLADGAAR